MNKVFKFILFAIIGVVGVNWLSGQEWFAKIADKVPGGALVVGGVALLVLPGVLRIRGASAAMAQAMGAGALIYGGANYVKDKMSTMGAGGSSTENYTAAQQYRAYRQLPATRAQNTYHARSRALANSGVNFKS